MQKGLICFLLATMASTLRNEATPLTKVIEMLSEMQSKAEKEKHEEEVQYAAYSQWCSDTISEKTQAISENKDLVMRLESLIGKFGGQMEAAQQALSEAHVTVGEREGDIKSSMAVREKESAVYVATHKDYTESIDALERAIAYLEKQNYNRPQAPLEFIQRRFAGALADRLKSMLAALQQPEPGQAHGYEFNSKRIIELLQELRDKFLDERTALMTAESNSRHAHTLEVEEWKREVELLQAEIVNKSSEIAAAKENKSKSESELNDTRSTLTADESYKDEVESTCSSKATEFEARKKLRGEEIEALRKALDIIQSAAVSPVYQKAVNAGLIDKGQTVLLQIAKRHHLLTQRRSGFEKTRKFLEKRAKKLDSHLLSILAIRLDQPEDPFAKVATMIRELISRLEAEAQQETTEKQFCDRQLLDNERLRNEKKDKVEEARTLVDSLTASIDSNSKKVAENQNVISDLQAKLSEATQLRAKEKEQNEASIQEARDGQEALSQALVILKDFYKKAGATTALIHHKRTLYLLKQPQIFDSPYRGMVSEKGGVIGMLEVIQADFSRLETDTASAENIAKREFASFASKTKQDIATYEMDTTHLEQDVEEARAHLLTAQQDALDNQSMLEAALDAYEKLKETCLKRMTFEERVQRREEEIESLKEALRILNSENFASAGA